VAAQIFDGHQRRSRRAYPARDGRHAAFGGDVSGNFLALDPTNGKLLCHARIGQVSNSPPAYLVDGRQHVLVAAEDRLYSFALY
jgi:alcohol dehydrogenase (cytochrome c)